jgi:hypothetical protein
MKKFNKLTAIAALFTLATFETNADTTNLVQSISIQLAGYSQGATQSNSTVIVTGVNNSHVGTDSVIAALGASTGNTFSRYARLVSVTPLPDGFSTIQVRDGSTSVDVTAFFTHEQFGDTLHTSLTSLGTGRFTENDFSVQRFALHNAGGFPALSLHFDVQGIAEDSDSATAGVSAPGSDLRSNVAGTGDRNGVFMILQGSISVRGHDTEVVPDGGGDGGPGV